MKKILFALAMGFALTGCVSAYDTYDGGGYADYSYGYSQEYIIFNNGYRYGYEAGVIDAITDRMVMAMALDRARAMRLLELNRRYFYIFHCMPNYSFGYYTFNPGPPIPRGPVGPGYYGGSNRPPYGGGYGDYYGRGHGGYRSDYNVNMTDRDLEAAAKEYTRSVRSIVGKDSYSTFETRVRADAKTANRKVNAIRVNPNLNANSTTNGSSSATRTRRGTNVRTNTNAGTTPTTSGTRVRSNSNSSTPASTTSGTRVRSNSNSSTPASTTSSTRVRSNSNSSGTSQQTTTNSRTRVRSTSSSNSDSSTTSTTSTTTSTSSSRTRTR
ncbi:MAG: hypothetical protein K5856_06280 [Bacteroidaceae bacterium]|nr:hypothetical protein [Bacteroidaceae bacterium]